jgi:hypothetical protein
VREVAQRFPGLRKLLIKGEELFANRQAEPDPGWLREKVNFTYEGER